MKSLEKKTEKKRSPETLREKICELPAVLALVGGIVISNPSAEAKGPIYDRINYAVDLSHDVKRDLAKAVWHALEQKAAKNIDRNDLYHCHVLLSKKQYEEKYAERSYTGTLSNLVTSIVKDYDGLLCHSQEFTSNGLDPTKRNILVFKGEDPEVIGPAPEPPWGITPQELGYVSPLTLYFDIDPKNDKKSATLPDGKHLKIVAERVQLLITPNVTIDLPFENKDEKQSAQKE